MARLSTVPRSSVGAGTIIPPETLAACKELVEGLDESQAGIITLDEDDDSAVYRKACETVATVLGVVVQVRKQRGSDAVLQVVKLTEEEAADFTKKQKAAAKKRSATAAAKKAPANGARGGAKK